MKVFLEKKKESGNMVVNDAKIYQKMKRKSWLSIEKNEMKKERPYYNHEKLISFGKFCFFMGLH